MELAWNELTISAAIQVPKTQNGKKVSVTEHKVLLNRLKGVMRPGHFTAIMGPSGRANIVYIRFGKDDFVKFLVREIDFR
jgi:hypothetical protein